MPSRATQRTTQQAGGTRAPAPRRKARASPAADKRPATRARGEDTRDRLIAAAFDQFLHRGFHGTSMRQIAAQAGLAVGGIYNHFASKDAIFAAVLDAYHPYRLFLPVLERAQGDTLEAFVSNAARAIEAAIAGSEEKLMPLVFIELVEFQGRHLQGIVERMFPSVIGFMQGFIERRPEMRDLPLPVVMRTLMSLMIGYLMTQLVIKNSPMFDGMGYDWFSGTIDIYLHGIMAKG